MANNRPILRTIIISFPCAYKTNNNGDGEAMNKESKIKTAIEQGDITELRLALEQNPEWANRKIVWGEDQKNHTEPLHYVSDCVFNGLLTNGKEAEITSLLLQYGAAIDGNGGAESPLIGAASLSASEVSKVLIDAGADIHAISLFGANALHWAAYVGTADVASELVKTGADIEAKCSEFSATALFWAVQGYSRYGPKVKKHQIGCAEVLIEAGAIIDTENCEGISALSRSYESETDAMSSLLLLHDAKT